MQMYSCGISTRQELCSSAKEDRKKGYNPLLMQQDCISRGPTTMLWFQPHSVHPELPDITPMGWKLESKDLVLFHSISKQQFRAVVRRSTSTTTTAAECLEDRVQGYVRVQVADMTHCGVLSDSQPLGVICKFYYFAKHPNLFNNIKMPI